MFDAISDAQYDARFDAMCDVNIDLNEQIETTSTRLKPSRTLSSASPELQNG